MKKSTQIVLSAVLVFSLAVFISACSSGGGGGSSTPSGTLPPPSGGTPPPAAPTVGQPVTLSTTTQGAQAATAGVNVAQQVTSSSGLLSSLVSPGAPKIKIPFASASSNNKAVAKFVSKIKPLVAKAKTLSSSTLSAPTTTTMIQTTDCTDGGTQTLTITMTYDDAVNPPTVAMGNMSMVYNNCQEGADLTNGSVSFSGITGDVNTDFSATITLGSASQPLTDKTCKTTGTTIDCTQLDDVSTSSIAMSISETVGTNTTTDVMTMNGWMQYVDYTVSPVTTDLQMMTNFSVTDVTSQASAALISGGTATFNVDELTLDGTMSSSHSETGNDYGASDAFSAFKVKSMTDSGYTTEYLTIDGTFAIATNPTDKCIEGTFNFATTTPIKTDLTSGTTVAGALTVNSVGVVFNADNTVTITVSGVPATYTEADLNGLCSL